MTRELSIPICTYLSGILAWSALLERRFFAHMLASRVLSNIPCPWAYKHIRGRHGLAGRCQTAVIARHAATTDGSRATSPSLQGFGFQPLELGGVGFGALGFRVN